MSELDLGRWFVAGGSDGAMPAGTQVRVVVRSGVVAVGPPGGPALEVPADSRHVDVIRGRLHLVSSDGVAIELGPASGQDAVGAANQMLAGEPSAPAVAPEPAPPSVQQPPEPRRGSQASRPRRPLTRRQRWGCLVLLAFGAVLLAYMAVAPRAEPYNGIDSTRYTTLRCGSWLALPPDQQAGFAQLDIDVSRLNAKSDQAKANLSQAKLSDWIQATTEACLTEAPDDLAFPPTR